MTKMTYIMFIKYRGLTTNFKHHHENINKQSHYQVECITFSHLHIHQITHLPHSYTQSSTYNSTNYVNNIAILYIHRCYIMIIIFNNVCHHHINIVISSSYQHRYTVNISSLHSSHHYVKTYQCVFTLSHNHIHRH